MKFLTKIRKFNKTSDNIESEIRGLVLASSRMKLVRIFEFPGATMTEEHNTKIEIHFEKYSEILKAVHSFSRKDFTDSFIQNLQYIFDNESGILPWQDSKLKTVHFHRLKCQIPGLYLKNHQVYINIRLITLFNLINE